MDNTHCKQDKEHFGPYPSYAETFPKPFDRSHLAQLRPTSSACTACAPCQCRLPSVSDQSFYLTSAVYRHDRLTFVLYYHCCLTPFLYHHCCLTPLQYHHCRLTALYLYHFYSASYLLFVSYFSRVDILDVFRAVLWFPFRSFFAFFFDPY